MPARGEIHVRLSVDYADNPRIIAAGEKAELLYVRALCLAKRLLSDGFISDLQLPRFGLTGTPSRARKLVEVGLWERVEDGYLICGWSERNKSRAEVEMVSAARSAAGALGGRPKKQIGFDSKTKPETGENPETETETETETSVASDVFGFPLRKAVDDASYTVTVFKHYRDKGTTVEKHPVRSDDYRAVLSLMGDDLDGYPGRARVLTQVIADYVAEVDPDPLSRTERGHAHRMVAEVGPLEAFRRVVEALQSGAGLEPEHRGKRLMYAAAIGRNGKAAS